MATDPTAPTVQRQNFATMSEADRNRWFDNITKMMENQTANPGTNALYDNMSVHGEPKKSNAPDNTLSGEDGYYCAHRESRFPGWHRFYVWQYEQAYQAADRAQGRDGLVGVPYWDWTNYDEATFPFNFLSEEQLNKLTTYPDNFYPPPPSSEPGFKYPNPIVRNHPVSIIYNNLRGANVKETATRSLSVAQFVDFASTEGNHPHSLEDPHNSVHVSVGGQMGQVPVSSYDFLFWLHHCNVDRYYEGWLRTHDLAEAKQNYHDADPDNFNTPCIPFRNNAGDYYMPVEAIALSSSFGFEFDNIPAPTVRGVAPLFQNFRLAAAAGGIAPAITAPEEMPPQQISVVFPNIDAPVLRSPSSWIEVFVVAADQADQWVPLSLAEFQNPFQSAGFAASAAIFTGGVGCPGCSTKRPFDLVVDVTHAMALLGLTPENAQIRAEVQEVRVDGGSDPFVLADGDGSGIPMPVFRVH